MTFNIDNPVDFKNQFECLESLVGKFGTTSDEKENAEIREKINVQISLLGTATLLSPTFQKSLEEFKKKIGSSVTTTEMSQLPKELENIKNVIIPMLSGPSGEEESKLAIEEPPESDVNQIPRERLEQDINVYARVFPDLSIPENLPLLEKYQYCKKNIDANRAGDIIQLDEGLNNESVHALLDLHVPLNSSILRNLSNYSPEIQKELVNRMEGIETMQMSDIGITEQHILRFLSDDADLLILSQYQNQQEQLQIDPASPEFNEVLQKTREAMILIHTKCEEFKKRIGNPQIENPYWEEGFKENIDEFLTDIEKTAQLAPLLVTYLDIYSTEPLSKEFIERAKMLGLKDLTEAVDRHPVSLDEPILEE